MTIEKFINTLGDKGIFLSFVNNELKVKGDQAALTSDVIGEIKSRKAELLQFFSSFNQHAEIESIPLAPEQENYPLTSAQKRLYFLYEFDLEATAYNMPYVLKLTGELQVEKLENAFAQLIQRHESLRTRFVKEGETAFQQIVPVEEVDFQIEKQILVSTETVEKSIEKLIRPFDLSQAPLFRIALLRLSEEEHLLLTDWHHIITDGTSQAILIKDFMEFYGGKTKKPLEIQYKDYAVWKGQENETVQESLRNFWTESFEAPVEAIELPTDYPRSSTAEKPGGVFAQHLNKADTEILNDLAKQNGATVFMTLLSLLNVLLSKLSNQKDVVIGTPVAGRDHADTQPLIGLFINTLALRNFPEPSLTFSEFLKEVKDRSLKAFEYSQYPFEELIENLNVSRTTNRNPLFDVMFALQNFQEEELRLPGLRLEPQAPQDQLAKFDLSITAVQQNGRLEISWEYDSSLFKAETIKRFASYLETLIEQVGKNAEEKLQDLKILTQQEEQQLHKFNATAKEYPLEISVVELFEGQARKTPDKTAVVFQEEELTYGLLDEKSNRLAKTLIEKGTQPNDIIGVLLEQSVEVFIAILAIHKAGVAFLPIDPSLPKDRINYMLEDSQAKIVLSDSAIIRDIDQSNQVWLDVNDQDNYGDPKAALPYPKAQDLAYVIYTSGTTGEPKGTLIEHGSLTNLCYWFNETYAVTAEDHTTKLAGLGFDATIFEIFPPLLKGATIHLFNQEDRLNPTKLNTYFEANSISLSFLPTPLCEQFIKLKNTSLRVLLTGGDKLNNAGHSNEYKLYNNYGPTETTVVATSYWVTEDQINIPIGKPIANTQTYVLNEALQLQPPGVAGELYIGGTQLARGYLNQPELTRERFIPNPFKSDERLYKTGDRARWARDGNIEFLGRNDDQIKIRGFRIELGEIERQLSNHPAITSAVVLAHEKQQDKYLVAYYTASKTTTDEELKSTLREQLPDYMIPSVFMKLEELPLNRSGKVDRKALPKPEINRTEDFVCPENEIEEQLVEIWSDVLQIPKDQISTTSNFFELGGHSLKATLVVNQLLKKLEVEIPVRDLFVHQDIQRLGAHIQAQTAATFQSIPLAPEQKFYPLASAQKRLYFLYEFDPEVTAYNMPYVLKLTGSLDITKLEYAFEQLIQRHESLRTRFVKEGETSFQQIVPVEQVDFKIEQRKLTSDESVEAYIEKFIRPFDLSQAPLFRIALLRLSEEEHLLLTDWHHIITDGTSQAILIKDFMEFYGGKTKKPLEIQYKDYAYWRAQHTDHLDQQRMFWVNQFSDEIPTLQLPGDFSLTNRNLNEGDVHLFDLTHEESAQVYKFLKEQQGITLFSFLMASFQVFLSRLTGENDIIIGSPVVNRSHADTENIIGLFLNTLPFRNQPERDKSFLQFLSEVQHNVLEAFENQEYPFEDLISELQLHRDLKHNPLFDVFFNLLNFEESAIELDDLRLTPLESDLKPEAKFYLTLYAKETNGQILFSCLYKSGFFQQASIQYLFEEFKKLLIQLVQRPELNLEAYQVFSSKQLEIPLETAPAPGKVIEPIDKQETEQSLVDRFQKIVAAYPNRIAVNDSIAAMSYQELDVFSNRVANHVLQTELVNQDEFAPRATLLFKHNISVMAGIWGALKAGYAYVPITVDQPLDRMAVILEDAQAEVLITDSEHMPVAEQVVQRLPQKVRVVNVQALPENTSSEMPAAQIKPDDLAYILYTSGSTGTPKGVMQIHRNVLHYWRVYTNALQIDHNDVFTMLSNYGHDAAVMSFFGTMLNGAAGVMYDIKEEGLEGLNDALIKYQISIYHSTPSVFRAFTSIISGKASPSVRLVVMGGEATLMHDVERYKALFDEDCLMLNGLGSTEATWQSVCFLDSNTDTSRSFIPVGIPLEGSSLKVLNEEYEIADVYEEGKLAYESNFITPGYWRDQQKTDQVIKTDLSPSGKRYYLSGDLGRRLPDGNIQYLGRNDHQVKIRGYRIELGEIENHLSSHTQIKAAAVMVFQYGAEKELVAYFSPKPGSETLDLKKYLSDKLPDHMIPRVYVELKQLPLNRNGKVDRKALPEPELSSAQAYVAPANETEKQLVRIWSKVLELPEERISTTGNFFEMGGHSLKATLVVNQISKQLNVIVPLKDLFLYQDIKHLAEHLQTLDSSDFKQISRAPEQDHYPLTSAQNRLYFLYEFDPEALAYNMPYVLRLKGDLDIPRLEATFTQLIYRHESLRTQFVKAGDSVFQKIIRPEEVNFKIHQLEGGSIDDREQLIRSFIRPFDLSEAPLFRVAIIKISAHEHLLFTDLHHIITDGTSQGILIRDFIAIYQGTALEPLDIHYKDYAYWRVDQGGALDQQKAYWVDRFSGEIPTLNLPGDLVLNNDNLTDGDHYLFELTAEETKQVHQFIKDQKGVTLFSFLLASFQVLLSRLASQEDITVGTPVVNRSHADTEKVIGLFLNTLPLRNHPERKKTFAQFLTEVQEGALEAFENQEYQFEDLISELNLKRDLQRNPLFDVFFNLLNFDQNFKFSLDELTIEAVESEIKPGAKFYLTLHAKEVDDQLLFSCLYKSGFFQPDTIRYIFEEFKKLLTQLILDPDKEIGSYQIFSSQVLEVGKQQPAPLKTFNRVAESEIEQTLVQRFQYMAEQFPNRIALKDAYSVITYRELDINSNRVANAILEVEGTEQDQYNPRAALLFGHNISMMQGIWGVLKAGHAYVPITADQPQERMISIIQDAEARVLITETAHVEMAQEVAKQIDIPVQVINIQSIGEETSSQCPEVAVKPDHLAYILYTSGSTGKPKGVMQIHRNAMHFWRVYTNALHLDQKDVLTMLSNYGHDAAVMSFFGALLNGATGILYDLKNRGLESLDQVIRENQVTVYHSTPSVFRVYTSMISEKASESVRLVVMGGEATLSHDVDRYKELFADDCLMINGLGPTESTVTVQNFIDKETETRQNVPVGLPVEGTRVYVLDKNYTVADVYQKGMLVYESEFITPGYWNDPERTQQTILTGLLESGKRYYLSGDMARRLPNGQIEFLGRDDHQVKVRGYRIELGEIESQLSSHPDVKSVVVLPFEKHQEKLLVAYYATRTLAQEVDLKSFLLQKVPDYMVPSVFMQLGELPLNRNGKVDKKALPAPEIDLNQTFVAPENETEEQLVEIWSEVLQMPQEKISTTSNFFELGGHSLLAMHMMHLILKKLDIEIDLKMLFQYPTIQLLSEAFKIHFDQDEALDEDEYDTIYL